MAYTSRSKPALWLLLSLAVIGGEVHSKQCQADSTEAMVCTDCWQNKIGAAVTKVEHAGEIPKPINQSKPIAASVFESTPSSTGMNSLQPKQNLEFRSERESEAVTTFDLDPQKQYQKMEGFGASLTEACAINLLKLTPETRHEVMEKIFSKSKGAGFDLLRLPIGLSDFSDGSKPDYSYDDSPGNTPDPKFKHFDMSRDEKTFALIREAHKINPDLSIIISPWSLPAWMKDSKSLRGGAVDPLHYEDYANYFVKVIREYQRRGIPVKSLTIQNEPGYNSDWVPTTGMTAANQAKFIGSYLGPKLAKEKIAVAIYAHDHNWDQVNDDTIPILDDPKARQFTAGVAYHCYGGYRWNMLDSMKKYPDVPTLQTECSGSQGSDPKGDFHWWLDNQALDAVKMGTTGALGWNLCLDQKGGPRVEHACDSCRGMITTDFSNSQPQVVYNGDFQALAQVSRFMQRGSRRIEVGALGIDNPKGLAFINPEGSISFIAQNTEATAKKIRIRLPDCKSITYEIPAMSAVSFKWPYESDPRINEAQLEPALESHPTK